MANYNYNFSSNIHEELLQNRIIKFTGEFNSDNCQHAIDQLLYLSKKDSEADISIYIDSPGGCVHSGLALIDVIDFIPNNVITVGNGMQASMGFMLLISGTKGKRYMLPHAQAMAHQVSSGTQGMIIDQEIRLAHSRKLNNILMQMIADKTGNTLAKVKKVCDRDAWMDAEEALKFGAIDKILRKEK